MSKQMGRPPKKLNDASSTLRTRIYSGVWKPGDLLPGEVELSRDLNISRMTLRSALASIEKDGLITRIQGKGTFVKSSPKTVKPLNKTLAILVYWSGEALNTDSYTNQLSMGMQAALQDSGFSGSTYSVPQGENLIDFIRKNPR